MRLGGCEIDAVDEHLRVLHGPDRRHCPGCIFVVAGDRQVLK
jgi:hypothetical protein